MAILKMQHCLQNSNSEKICTKIIPIYKLNPRNANMARLWQKLP